MMKVAEMTHSEELDEKWGEENIKACSVIDVESGDNMWGYVTKKYDV